MTAKQMNPSEELAGLLREWTDVFMRRSMRSLVRYSKGMGLSLS